MKERIFTLTCGGLLFIAFIVFVACNNDDESNKVNKMVKEAFEARFPGATAVDWNMKKSYYKADFKWDEKDHDAWFMNTGVWLQTESDMTYVDLPELVKTAFTNGMYADWRVDNVEKLERLNMLTLYRIEVKKSSSELELYFDEMGDLVRESNEDQATPVAIRDFIRKNYEGTVTVETSHLIGGMWIVDLLSDGRVKEVFFDSSSDWIRTQWAVAINELPTNVTDVLRDEAFQGYTLKSAEYREESSGQKMYRLRLEKTGSVDLYVEVSPEGQLL